MVRAKFKLTRFETQMSTVPRRDAVGNAMKNEAGSYVYDNVEQRTLIFHPVYSSDPGSENAMFWAATPNGEVKLGVVNPAAWRHFELDKEYYLDFTPAAPAES